jgi:predicted membrane chloride channel (bestrophin family)
VGGITSEVLCYCSYTFVVVLLHRTSDVTPPTLLCPPFHLEQIVLHSLVSFLPFFFYESAAKFFHTKILVESRSVIRRVV